MSYYQNAVTFISLLIVNYFSWYPMKFSYSTKYAPIST